MLERSVRVKNRNLNPKTLAICVIILNIFYLLFEFLYYYDAWSYSFNIFDYFILLFSLLFNLNVISLLYFCIILFSKKLDLKALNMIYFIFCVIYVCYSVLSLMFYLVNNNNVEFFPVSSLFSAVFEIVFVNYLRMIFFNNKLSFDTNNFNYVCLMFIWFVHFCSVVAVSANNFEFKTFMFYICSYVYFVPLLMYFNLYSKNSIKKKEG